MNQDVLNEIRYGFVELLGCYCICSSNLMSSVRQGKSAMEALRVKILNRLMLRRSKARKRVFKLSSRWKPRRSIFQELSTDNMIYVIIYYIILYI